MGEVRYSVNGKYFKDWNVFVSDSEGLFGALKRKKVNSYQWAEYHGQSVDLSNPKYEAREITLKCFVVGDNWVAMKANFDALVSEFQKSGTQRLLIEPFGLNPLPYEVYMEDSSELQKTFKEGKMAGVFSLKLIEPNPIKKVLYLTGSSLNLAYNSPKETEIFYGNGLKETASGNVSLSGKTLANRVVSGYNFEGRNFILNSSFINETISSQANITNIIKNKRGYYATTDAPFGNDVFGFYETKGADRYFYLNTKNNVTAGEYIFSCYYMGSETVTKNSSYLLTDTGVHLPLNFDVADNQTHWKKVSCKVTIPQGVSWVRLRLGTISNGAVWSSFTSPKLEKGAVATPYSIAPEEEKFIIIAGNIEGITNLTTNAEVLWEKL